MKPQLIDDYVTEHAAECERLLVTLLRGVGPLRDSIYLVGGLTPRYLIKKRPPDVAAHAGTLDLDVVVDLQILTEAEAYRTLEENLKHIGLERGSNNKGKKVSWRWEARTKTGSVIVLELLTDDPSRKAGSVEEIKGEGNISALNIPYASMVRDFHEKRSISAELLGEGGVATVDIRFADIVSFSTLKALAFRDRNERKDAHDIVYCIENYEGGVEYVVDRFRKAMESKHKEAVALGLKAIRTSFATYDNVEGFDREGPHAVANFEIGEGDGSAQNKERHTLRRREAHSVVAKLLKDFDL